MENPMNIPFGPAFHHINPSMNVSFNANKLRRIKSGRKNKKGFLPLPIKSRLLNRLKPSIDQNDFLSSGRKGRSITAADHRTRMTKKGRRKASKKTKKSAVFMRKGYSPNYPTFRTKRGRKNGKGFFPLMALIPGLIAAGKAAALGAVGAGGAALANKVLKKGRRGMTCHKPAMHKLFKKHKGNILATGFQAIKPKLIEGIKNAVQEGVKNLGSTAIIQGAKKLFNKIFKKKKAGQLIRHLTKCCQKHKKGDLNPDFMNEFHDILDTVSTPDLKDTFITTPAKKPFLSKIKDSVMSLFKNKTAKKLTSAVVDRAISGLQTKIANETSGNPLSNKELKKVVKEQDKAQNLISSVISKVKNKLSPKTPAVAPVMQIVQPQPMITPAQPLRRRQAILYPVMHR